MRRAPATTSLNYEEIQNWNRITSWLHSLRYRHALEALASFADKRIDVLEIGSATGKLFGLLDARQPITYTGIELYPALAQQSQERYGTRPNFRVVQGDALTTFPSLRTPDVVIALETLEHILEPQVVRIVEQVAAWKPKLFLVSVPVEIGPAIWAKNIGSALLGYGRHRSYGWRKTFWAGFSRLDKLPPHGSDHIGFDWRWLAQTLRHHFRVTIKRSPFPFLPTSCNATAFMVCTPWSEEERPRVG